MIMSFHFFLTPSNKMGERKNQKNSTKRSRYDLILNNWHITVKDMDFKKHKKCVSFELPNEKCIVL